MLIPTAVLTAAASLAARSEEHTSELQSRSDLVCRLLLEKKKHRRDRRSNPDWLPCAEHVRRAGRRHVVLRPPRAAQRPLRHCQERAAGLRVFFFNDPGPTEIYPLSLHDALPICLAQRAARRRAGGAGGRGAPARRRDDD